jgi:hypothetical protein
MSGVLVKPKAKNEPCPELCLKIAPASHVPTGSKMYVDTSKLYLPTIEDGKALVAV